MSPNIPSKVMPSNAEWQAAIAPFRAPIPRAAAAQLLNTLIPYVLCIAAAYSLYAVAYWAALPFIVLASLFTVRTFIISHDCGHGSFTANKQLNDLIGFWTGCLAYTPYLQWRRAHAIHHADSGNVQNDGTGYIWYQTTRQYESKSFLQRLGYRLYRNPLVILGFGGPWLFLIEYRLFDRGIDGRAKRQVCAVNALWLAFGALIWLTLGPMALLKVQLPIMLIGTAMGVWLFYFQHHYPDAYFGNEKEWDFTRAALEGSSFLKLPRWLQFFSGNIGFHHVHHLSPKIPNYRLEECHEAVPFLKAVPPLTLRDCAKAITFSLVDSKSSRWTTFRRAARAEASGSVLLARGTARVDVLLARGTARVDVPELNIEVREPARELNIEVREPARELNIEVREPARELNIEVRGAVRQPNVQARSSAREQNLNVAELE